MFLDKIAHVKSQVEPEGWQRPKSFYYFYRTIHQRFEPCYQRCCVWHERENCPHYENFWCATEIGGKPHYSHHCFIKMNKEGHWWQTSINTSGLTWRIIRKWLSNTVTINPVRDTHPGHMFRLRWSTKYYCGDLTTWDPWDQFVQDSEQS